MGILEPEVVERGAGEVDPVEADVLELDARGYRVPVRPVRRRQPDVAQVTSSAGCALRSRARCQTVARARAVHERADPRAAPGAGAGATGGRAGGVRRRAGDPGAGVGRRRHAHRRRAGLDRSRRAGAGRGRGRDRVRRRRRPRARPRRRAATGRGGPPRQRAEVLVAGRAVAARAAAGDRRARGARDGQAVARGRRRRVRGDRLPRVLRARRRSRWRSARPAMPS